MTMLKTSLPVAAIFVLSITMSFSVLTHRSVTTAETVDASEPSALEPAPTDAWAESSVALSSAWDEARQLEDAKDYAMASNKYQQIAMELPVSTQKAKASYLSGLCLVAAGQQEQAIQAFDEAIAVGQSLTIVNHYNVTGKERPKVALGKGRRISIRSLMEESISHRVRAHYDTGNREGAHSSFRQLCAEFPNSRHISRLIPIYANLIATSGEVLSAEEQIAHQLFHEARGLIAEGQEQAALDTIDHLLLRFPRSSVALHAMSDKAMVLWGKSNFAKASELFSAIQTEAASFAPNSQLVRQAESRIAWLGDRPTNGPN